MNFRQTKGPDRGRKSPHKIGVFLGQLRGENSDLEGLLRALAEAGADAVELDTWALSLDRAEDLESAAGYAKELHALAAKNGLTIVSLAAHLQGQALGDNASKETVGWAGEGAQAAYEEWAATNFPPLDDPYWVPEGVAQAVYEGATDSLMAVGRLALALGDIQDRKVPVSGFTGAPCRLWRHWFPFPPIPEIAKGASLLDRAYEVLFERFGPVWDLYRDLGVHFGLECHPGEIAMGDLASAERFLKEVDIAGYPNVGFNFDPSHMEWQGVDSVAFVQEFGERIWSAHLKGVTLRSNRSRYTRAGILGGYLPFGDLRRDMDFVFAGSDGDICPIGQIIIALNKVGYSGALTIEAEDTASALIAGLPAAIARLRSLDIEPSGGAFDRAFNRKEDPAAAAAV